MKKICKQNGEISFSGESGINSICFKAYITKGPVSISKDAVIARIDEKGEITCSNKDSSSGSSSASCSCSSASAT